MPSDKFPRAPRLKLMIGKIRSTGAHYSWEPDYVDAIKEQCNDLTGLIRSICNQIENVTPDICLNALAPTMELAVYYCPVDTGVLRESAYLENISFRGKPRVECGFARGGNPHYAVIVHEDLEHFHNPPTTAKFLERAVNEDLRNIETRIIGAYQEFMGK